MSAEHLDSGSADEHWMQRALQLALQGRGAVEPNPMVGCVVVRDGVCVAEGWHQRFGGPHAERVAIATAADRELLHNATWYITLEPCCHSGKTPPCTDALLEYRPRRVVVAMQDPFPQVNGGGLNLIKAWGCETTVGVCQAQAERLNAPYLMRLRHGRPWVIGKWAMSLDGKIATRLGSSQWISGELSRQRVHAVRGCVDAIMVGIGTALADNPMLNARPPGPRVATRVIFDRGARLPLDCQLVKTAREIPLMVVCDGNAAEDRGEALKRSGVEILPVNVDSSQDQAKFVLAELGKRGFTNVLVEGGAGLLASFFEADCLDEVMVFVAPKIIGGEAAATPISGQGIDLMDQASRFEPLTCEQLGEDVLLQTRRKR